MKRRFGSLQIPELYVKFAGSVDPPILYNTKTSFITADDIESLLLTPQMVWGVSAEGDVIMFDRGKRGMGFLSLYRDPRGHGGCRN